MATSLAAQLAQIAASSKTTLDIKAQRAAHGKSLLFEPSVAAKQNFQTLYKICREGFDELCRLDTRFIPFGATIFSEQSQNEDRSQMTAAENAELDKRTEFFLRLVGGRLMLMPAIKSVEWLIRRFRVHDYNAALLISTFLPYHTTSQPFVTLLDILPDKLPYEFRFLDPYKRSAQPLPREVLVREATQHPELLSTISTYTLESCRHQQQYPALISLWGGIMTQAVNGMLDKMRSGRQSVQKSNDQDLLHQIGPILGEALMMRRVPGIQIASYMVIAVFVSKGNLEDRAISAFMEQLVEGWSPETLRTGLVCLSYLAQYRSPKQMPKRVTKALLNVPSLPELLEDIGKEYSVEKLCNGLCVALIDRLSKKGDSRGLALIESIVSKAMLSERQLTVIFKSLLLAAHKVDESDKEQATLRHALASTLVRFSQANGQPGEVFTNVLNETQIDIEALEMKLDAAIRPKTLTSVPHTDEAIVGDTEVENMDEDFDSMLNRLKHTSPQGLETCLSSNPPDIYTDLCSLYLSAVPNPSNLAAFRDVACLQQKDAAHTPFFITFFIRIWCGPYPALARLSALEIVKERLKSSDCESIDFQALIPYCIAALGDPSRRVRRAAADMLTVLDERASINDVRPSTRWSSDKLYGPGKQLEWLPAEVSHKLLHNILLPALEECVLNAEQIYAVVENTFSGSRTSLGVDEKQKKAHLSHNARLSILTFLASHIIETPLMTVRLRLLQPLNQVKSISGTSRTQVLLPFLQWWSSLSADEAKSLCSTQGIDPVVVDESVVAIALPNDKAGLEFLLDILQQPHPDDRQALERAILARFERMWSSMKGEAQQLVAQRLLGLVQDSSKNMVLVKAEAASLLKNVELSTETLLSFLESLQSPQNLANMATEAPPNKRRRASSSDSSRPAGAQINPDVGKALKRVTFVLELVEGSNPANHPQLLNALFNTLAELQHFRSLLGSELGYLQNLVLRSLLAMVPAYGKDKTLKIDGSVGHGDLLVNCIQKSSSPAVYNTAVLLMAGLAGVAPELVIHSAMPIFTHMGSSVLRQSDDYSAHVINETVKQLVPAIVESLRKGKKNPLTGVSELLLSFVTAFEHIPSHRRLGLFVSLVETLGPDEFLFALLAMLVDKYGAANELLSFATEVFDSFRVEVQLQSLVQLVDLVKDMFQATPKLSSILLGTSEEGVKDSEKMALGEFGLISHLLSSSKLGGQVKRLTERDDMDAAKVREVYASLLKDLLSLTDILKARKVLYDRCSDCLPRLLHLLSIGEFIKAVETLLDQPEVVIRRKVLRALQDRIDRESQSDANSRAALLAFLPHLTEIIRDSDDILHKYTAVECVDKIAEKYGKKDPEAVSAAALTIAGDQCLGKDDAHLRVVALLCLASLVDVLQDGMVPVLPAAIPRCLLYLKESIEVPNVELHSAGYSFLTSLAQHLPYMVSGSSLDQLFAVSSASAAAGLGAQCDDARLECLQSLAKRIDAKTMFSSLERSWTVAAESGFIAVKEYLEILAMAIDRHSKADISKNVTVLSSIFLSAFDLRRTEITKNGGSSNNNIARNLSRIEDTTNAVALRMVYKLNDAAFRPIFAQLMDWAITGLPKTDTTGRNLRLLGVFSFLLSFFGGSLKSIVTSYASYIIEAAVGVLNATNLKGTIEERELWKKVVQTLAKCFEHDQDGFWTAPAHFNAVSPPLTAQFLHAASLPSTDPVLLDNLIPAIVELAGAANSQDHQKEVNSALLKHLRSEHAAVRLAAVKCEQKLAEKLGEEWLAMLPEMLPYISELQEDDDENVERETQRWIVGIEGVLGESLEGMLQ